MNDIETVAELIDEVKKQPTIVYGTGYVAERLMSSLKEHGVSGYS